MITTIDIRNSAFRDVRELIAGDCERIYLAMLAAGSGQTVREWAAHLGEDVLSVAPRICDLQKIGAVELAGHDGRRGVYRARTEPEWVLWHHHLAAGGEQMQLGL